MNKIVIFITLIPFIGSLIIINRVEPFVMGLPFVLFWCSLWVVLTSVFLLIAYKIDPKNREE